MTLSDLECHSPIAGLFKCDVFALVLLFLDLFLLLCVHLICASKQTNKYLPTYFLLLTYSRVVGLYSHCMHGTLANAD